ncbi:Frag1/DRAM/Sfk1 family-domain-containing protein [Mycena pura]|uniref:Frag1/DRAM/Sfk1 family-domain-containing protein n=1 Tax=Mycena pura TaxID=153505 RepID=A0AAD6YGB2_9AGAR|nr:Frag1/DRAM/Sfk1 family-domain-containing protein [Mycena pura]
MPFTVAPRSTDSEPHPHAHWGYVWIPIFAAFMWFGTILAMLITWLAQGGTSRPRYASQSQSIAYISDVGADILKPLFVTGCSITAVTFFLSLVVERYLRHSGRLVPTMRRREKVFSVLAVLGSAVGGAGLILLSVFDTKRFPRLHRGFLLMYMVGVALSAIFTLSQYRWISKSFRYLRQLRIAYIAKGIIAGVLVVLAIAFGVALDTKPNVGAVLEWTISFGFTFYLLTFYYDLRQAKGVHKGELTPQAMRSQRRWVSIQQRFGYGRGRER